MQRSRDCMSVAYRCCEANTLTCVFMRIVWITWCKVGRQQWQTGVLHRPILSIWLMKGGNMVVTVVCCTDRCVYEDCLNLMQGGKMAMTECGVLHRPIRRWQPVFPIAKWEDGGGWFTAQRGICNMIVCKSPGARWEDCGLLNRWVCGQS